MLHRTHLQFKENLQHREETTCIIIHHSEVSTPHTVQDIHRWHQKKGWAGIGYHYFIKKSGEIYEGRPYHTIGAHAKGYNANSIGICFEGDFNKETMSQQQLDASVMLLSMLSLAYDHATICGHSLLVEGTTCPGKNFPIDSLIEKVDTCITYIESLFGEQISESFGVDEEWRHFHDGMGDEEEENRRHNAPEIAHLGNFNYQSFLQLLDEIYDIYGWE